MSRAHHRLVCIFIHRWSQSVSRFSCGFQPAQGPRNILRLDRTGNRGAVSHHFQRVKRVIAKHGDIGKGICCKRHQHIVSLICSN